MAENQDIAKAIELTRVAMDRLGQVKARNKQLSELTGVYGLLRSTLEILSEPKTTGK